MTEPSTELSAAEPEASTVLPPRLGARLVHALGPVAGGLVLDFADLATIGPAGLYGGLFVGAAVGWWMSGLYRFGRAGRVALAALAGIYCMLPFTSFLPVATVLSAVGRFLEGPPTSVD